MDYLIFRLYGPVAAWGEIAVGEIRHTAVYPSKSALLGLLAAAMGIRRDEEDRQTSLAAGYHFAVKVLSPGSLLTDYHTIEVPKGKRFATRRDEIEEIERQKRSGIDFKGTILSSREYRCDALSVVAVKALNDAPYPLSILMGDLQRPKFHLYLGRKSCPLSAPLNPRIISAPGYRQAFDAYAMGVLYMRGSLKYKILKEGEKQKPKEPWIDTIQLARTPSWDDEQRLALGENGLRYYWEGDTGDLEPQQDLVRRDQPLSRTRWQFSQRLEHLYLDGEEA